MFSKYYILCGLIVLIQLSSAARKVAQRLEPEEQTDDVPDVIDTEEPSATRRPTSRTIDVNYYYRLSNRLLGTGKVLDVISSGGATQLMMSRINGRHSQQFYFVAQPGGSFAIRNRMIGDEFSLDVVNDEEKHDVVMAYTGGYPGQMWQLVPQGDASYRLFNRLTGVAKSLDLFSNTETAFLGEDSVQPAGQLWAIEKLGPREQF